MLEFENTLGFVALAVLPLVWILLRVPAARVSSDRVDLWRKALSRVPRARQESNWRRVVTMLAIAGLVTALARPRIPAKDGVRTRIAVFDASLSMYARDDGRVTRLERAVDRWQSTAAPEHVDEVLYVLSADRLRAIPIDDAEARTRGALMSRIMRANRLPADPRVVTALADRVDDRTRVEWSSDGAGPSPWPVLPASLRARVHCVGFGRPDTENARIASVSLEDPWPGPELTLRLSVARIASTTGIAVERPVRGAPARRIASSPMPPDGEGIEIRIPRGEGGRVRVVLENEDALPHDDTVRVQLRAAWAPALWLSPEDSPELMTLRRFLESTLDARATGTREDFARAARRRGGLIVVDGGRLPAWPTDGVVRILFGTALPGLEDTRDFDGFASWDRDHELLEGLDLGVLRAERARTGSGPLPGDAFRLVTLDGDPLVLFSPTHRLLWFGLRLDSKLVTRPCLPLLLLRVLPRIVPADPAADRDGGPSRVIDRPGPAAEADLRARPAPPAPSAPTWWQPAIELWQYAAGFAALCFLALAVVP